MEQVRLCAVWPMENWLGSFMNHKQGWMTVWGCCWRALEKRCLPMKQWCHPLHSSQSDGPSLLESVASLACHPPIELSENSYRNSSTIAPLSLSSSSSSSSSYSFLPPFLSPLFRSPVRCPQREKSSALILNIICCALRGIHSAAMFCFVFFLKFWLTIGLHSISTVSLTADGTCKK